MATTAVAVDRDRLVETASRMIGTHSFTGDEEGMARLMVELFESRGLHVQWQQVEDGRANALGTWSGAGGGPSLMFNGHMDTSYSGREPWLRNVRGFQPSAFVEDGRLYGLGISNMKGALACYVEAVSALQDAEFIFPTGRGWAEELGYPQPELSRVPDASVESFAGVANHWLLGRIEPGEVVLDLGCGAGTDLLIAAQMTGPAGRVIGVDMTTSMLDRVRASAAEMGITNLELHESLIEELPVDDASVDVVISNGVIDLVPDKEAVFDEIDRVLRPGGRLQFADVVIHTEVSEDARARIDLWTG